MKKNKKKLIIISSLLVAMVALIGLYVFLPSQDNDKESENDEKVKLGSFEKMSVMGFTVTSDKFNYDLICKNDVWNIVGKENIKTNNEIIDKMLTEVESIEADQELGFNEDQAEDYGINNPTLVLKIKMKDNKETTFIFGDTIPAIGGRYGQVNDDLTKLYALSDTFFDTFYVDEKTLYLKDQVPEIKADYITGVSYSGGKSVTPFVVHEVAKVDQIEDYSTWNMTKPYKEELAVNPNKISEIQSNFSTFTLGDLVENDVKDIKKYGFSKDSQSIKVDYFLLKEGAKEKTRKDNNGNDVTYVDEKDRDNKSFILYIGKAKDDDNYYVRIGNSKNIYLMSKSEIIKLTEIDAFEYVDHCVYAVLATKLKGYEVKFLNTEMIVKRETRDEKNIWDLNGTKIKEENEDEFLNPYSAMYLLEYSGVIKPNVKPKNNKPVFSVVYHANEGDVKVNYLPYDGVNFYRVEKNGKQLFLVNKRSVDDLMKKYIGIQKLID